MYFYILRCFGIGLGRSGPSLEERVLGLGLVYITVNVQKKSKVQRTSQKLKDTHVNGVVVPKGKIHGSFFTHRQRPKVELALIDFRLVMNDLQRKYLTEK